MLLHLNNECILVYAYEYKSSQKTENVLFILQIIGSNTRPMLQVKLGVFHKIGILIVSHGNDKAVLMSCCDIEYENANLVLSK